ncbi:rhamnan synthesis F family protein [Ancylobacter mangrovi]|uniref:rhamnan synthesis F family protein n=1 Tax=Ancylobacter mangrovi TaxID=2972472 RepID=UPI002161C019|nr:rhamnan synthesis F family protein [Ancylobacter mangrovi]MCS0503137.1 glycosyltransferase [Ancylobacter mangrovi]
MLDRPDFDESAAVGAGLLTASLAFSTGAYRELAGLAPEADAALHYVTEGWRQELEPLSGIETAYLAPYLASIGLDMAPAVAWLYFDALGLTMPATREAAERLARAVATSASFDEAHYRKWVPDVPDAALHYVLLGEAVGLRPSENFDPAYYRENYPDVTAFLPHSRLIKHYDDFGRMEGRRGRPHADDIRFEPLPEGRRPAVLMICHEASRTGAPILGWNIIRQLEPKYRVVSVLLHGGDLEEEFRAAAAASVAPLNGVARNPVEMRSMAKRLLNEYRPLYVIANSIETQPLAAELGRLGVPVVALVHEFATYSRPHSKLEEMFGWASEVVFPARVVAQSSFEMVTGLEDRSGIHILPQGRSELPPSRALEDAGSESLDAIFAPLSAPVRQPSVGRAPDLRLPGQEDAIVVLGAGWVQLRKGVEAFVETAVVARRLRPDLKLRFVWVGDGFDPRHDLTYSVYLDDQIRRSDLGDSFAMMPAVDDIAGIYRQTDIFLLSSRLDPQPNVAIDAMSLGIPVVCFAGGVGTAEVLAEEAATRELVVPHLDAAAAAQLICRLAEDRAGRERLGEELVRLAARAFDMEAYVAHIDGFGRRAAERLAIGEEVLNEAMAVIDPFLLFTVHESWTPPHDWPRIAAIKWRLWNGVAATEHGRSPMRPVRRAVAGFHPTLYALARRAACLDGDRDPLVHWLESGRPQGPWSRPVHLPRRRRESGLRLALHAHFHYPELADDLIDRLRANASRPDLFVTTDSALKAEMLATALARYPGRSEVRTVPNAGRDVGAFLTGLADVIGADTYDVIGHVHAKRSLAVDAQLGERWRSFLWTNLIGGRGAMIDTAALAFEEDPGLGLLIAEDPNVIGWNANREVAQELARRMGIEEPLPDFFDFPLGTMFWARREGLRPLLDLDLSWQDYPPEPLPGDGTVLHALERLIPFAVGKAGLGMAGLRVPGTSW